MSYDELLAELKARYRIAAAELGEGPARRAFLKATAKPMPLAKLEGHGQGVGHWSPEEAA